MQIFDQERVSENVGMPNIQRRLELHYGHGSTMKIHSIPGDGTTVILSMFMSEEESTEKSGAGVIREGLQEDGKWIL